MKEQDLFLFPFISDMKLVPGSWLITMQEIEKYVEQNNKLHPSKNQEEKDKG